MKHVCYRNVNYCVRKHVMYFQRLRRIGRLRFSYTMLSTCICERSIKLLRKAIRTSETVDAFAARLLDSGLAVGFTSLLLLRCR